MKLTRSLILCLLQLFIFGISVLASPVPWGGRELWEGSKCELENGRLGECVKAVDCPKKMEDIIRWGNYSDEGRCSFWKFDEIVCCEKRRSEGVRINRVRKAAAACQKYKDEEMKKKDEDVFRIVVYNGVSVDPGEYPQVVALGYPDQSDDELVVNGIKYICGGTLISERHVLTAAHCVNNVQGFIPTEVVVGTTELTTTKITPKLRVPISKITRHPDYRRSFHYNDIAVIQLKNSVTFSSDVRPACLATEPPRTPTDGSRSPLVVLGWGAIDIDGTRSPKLLKADWLNLVERSKCSQSYNKEIGGKIPNGLNDGMVCAADPDTERRSDTCPGDSGGPLFVKGDKFPALVGVTSFGQACSVGAPGVYTAVHRYLDWIEDQVWP